MRLPRDSIVWWEARRILFNVIVFITGIVNTGIYIFICSRWVPAGEDVFEPPFLVILMLAYGIAANVFYTLGWITETIWSGGDTTRTQAMRPKVFWLGIIFSICVTFLPAIFAFLLWVVRGFK